MNWLKNTAGEPDAVLTMTLIALIIVLAKLLMMGVTIGGVDLSLGTIDASTIGAVLTPTLGAYVARRYTDKKFTSDPVEEKKDQVL